MVQSDFLIGVLFHHDLLDVNNCFLLICTLFPLRMTSAEKDTKAVVGSYAIHSPRAPSAWLQLSVAPAAFGSTSLVICREIFQGGSEAPGPVGLWMLQKVQERIAFRKKKNRLILVCHSPLPKLKMTTERANYAKWNFWNLSSKLHCGAGKS